MINLYKNIKILFDSCVLVFQIIIAIAVAVILQQCFIGDCRNVFPKKYQPSTHKPNHNGQKASTAGEKKKDVLIFDQLFSGGPRKPNIPIFPRQQLHPEIFDDETYYKW